MLLKYLLLGIIIGANNFAVSLTLGATGHYERKQRVLVTFGIFEFTVPLLGSLIGKSFSTWLQSNLNWLPPTIFILIGVITLIGLIRGTSKNMSRITSTKGIILLAFGLSIDNLALGWSRAAARVRRDLCAKLRRCTSALCRHWVRRRD